MGNENKQKQQRYYCKKIITPAVGVSWLDARAEMGEMNIHRKYSDERNEAWPNERLGAANDDLSLEIFVGFELSYELLYKSRVLWLEMPVKYCK